jgi:hypothetical protein
LEEKDILKRLVENEALFRNIHVITQNYDIIPKDNKHIGAYIEFQDIRELREDFLEELIDSIVDWIYSSDKFVALKQKAMDKGKSEAAATQEVGRKARQKFRADHNTDKLLIQGQFGELLLFHFIQRFMKATPLLRKMKIATSSEHERFGADAIHYKIQDGKNIIILGEAKTYSSKYKFAKAFEDAINSIVNTYKEHRRELNFYVHEDFLDNDMNEVAEDYLNNELKNVEVHLVSIITYNENRKRKLENESNIRKQIEKIIADRYHAFDNSKIDIEKNPILKRITYIVFPVWDLRGLAQEFQNMI